MIQASLGICWWTAWLVLISTRWALLLLPQAFSIEMVSKGMLAQ
jgi:hypothetical protein